MRCTYANFKQLEGSFRSPPSSPAPLPPTAMTHRSSFSAAYGGPGSMSDVMRDTDSLLKFGHTLRLWTVSPYLTAAATAAGAGSPR
jgi:hypothetical protein